jgi:hypothetical protein
MSEPTTTAVRLFGTWDLFLFGLFVVGLMAVTSCAVMSDPVQHDVLDREWAMTADFIRTEAVQTLTVADFEAPQTSGAQARLLNFYHRTMLLPDIISVKVYDADTRVLWSDKAQLVGEGLRDNPELSAALIGHTAVHFERLRRSENIYEPNRATLVEVYVPIVFETGGRTVGVVEVYKRPSRALIDTQRSADETLTGTN